MTTTKEGRKAVPPTIKPIEAQVKDEDGQFVVYDVVTGKKKYRRKTPKPDVPVVTREDLEKTLGEIEARKQEQDTSGLVNWEDLPTFLVVDPRMTDEDVVKLDESGVELRFDFERFRELDGNALDKLGRDNVQRYWVEQAIFRKMLRRLEEEEEFGARPKGRIEVIGRTAEGRLRSEGVPVGIHPYWAAVEEEHEWKRNGYTILDKKRFPEIKAGDSTAGDRRYCKTSDGREELVLMGCPVEVYEDYIQEMSDESRRKVAAAEGMTQNALEQHAGLKGVRVKQEMETEKVSIPGLPQEREEEE